MFYHLNQALCKCIVMNESCEQRLITKKHIAMHTNVIVSLYSRIRGKVSRESFEVLAIRQISPSFTVKLLR